MKVNVEAQLSPIFRILSDDQLYEIHLGSLEVLERVGVKVDEPEARKLLKSAGAIIDEDSKICKIPSDVVQSALNSAPPRVVLADRDNNRCMFLEKNNPYFGTGSDLHYVIDPYTGERRSNSKQDIENTTRVVDALPNIDFMMSMGIAKDEPASVSDLHQFEAMVNNTTKPMLITSHHRQSLLDQVEMAAIVRGGLENLQANPLFSLYTEPVSPLCHSTDGLQKLMSCAEYRIPVNYTPGLCGGGTGPVTRAGAFVTANAELLSALTIHQLKRKGSPFIYGGVATILDMKSTLFSYAAPEMHIGSAVLTQLSKMYELPMFSTAGCSDSNIFDEQAALESAYTILLAALSGANLIHDVGYVESGMTCSYEMLVVSDEIIDMVRHMMKNFAINTNTLAIDVIENVGPGGQYVTNEHTFANFKEEMWFPKLLNRNRRDSWEQTGSMTLSMKANEKARDILENYHPPKLSEKKQEEIKTLISKRLKSYESKKLYS